MKTFKITFLSLTENKKICLKVPHGFSGIVCIPAHAGILEIRKNHASLHQR